MKRLILGITALTCVGLWAGFASAADPYRDRHFAHYALHDNFALQDFHRHSYAAGYPATVWSREVPIEQATLVPPIGELPPVPLPPRYEYRRRGYEYRRTVPVPVGAVPVGVVPRPGSPSSYTRTLPSSTDLSPSEGVPPAPSPWRRSYDPSYVP